MEVDELLQRIVRRHGAMLFLFVLTAAVAASLVRVSLPAQYTSIARVVLRPEPPSSAAEAQTAADEAAALITSDSFLERALKTAGEPSGSENRALVHATVSPLGTSGVAEIVATYRFAPDVTTIAQSLATQYIGLQTSVARQNVTAVLKEIDTELASLGSQIGHVEARLRAAPPGSGADILSARHLALMNQRATLADRRTQVESDAALAKIPVLVDSASPSELVSSHWAQDAALAGLVGLVVGLLAAALREIISPSLVGRRAVAKALGIPLLGYLPGPPWSMGTLESKETRDIAASAFLLADAQKLDGLELLGVGPDPDLDQLAKRLTALVEDLQPTAPERQPYSPFLAALGQPKPTRRFAIRNFADERRQAKPGAVVLVVPTSLAAADVERAKDLVSIGNRRILGVISFGKKAPGPATSGVREPVHVIRERSRAVRTSAREA